jgi:hypothetical protein
MSQERYICEQCGHEGKWVEVPEVTLPPVRSEPLLSEEEEERAALEAEKARWDKTDKEEMAFREAFAEEAARAEEEARILAWVAAVRGENMVLAGEGDGIHEIRRAENLGPVVAREEQ